MFSSHAMVFDFLVLSRKQVLVRDSALPNVRKCQSHPLFCPGAFRTQDTNTKIPREAEAFFPPPENLPPVSGRTSSKQKSSSKTAHDDHYQAKQQGRSPSHSSSSPSSPNKKKKDKKSSQESTTPSSPSKKKKAPYVPPTPITEPVGGGAVAATRSAPVPVPSAPAATEADPQSLTASQSSPFGTQQPKPSPPVLPSQTTAASQPESIASSTASHELSGGGSNSDINNKSNKQPEPKQQQQQQSRSSGPTLSSHFRDPSNHTGNSSQQSLDLFAATHSTAEASLAAASASTPVSAATPTPASVTSTSKRTTNNQNNKDDDGEQTTASEDDFNNLVKAAGAATSQDFLEDDDDDDDDGSLSAADALVENGKRPQDILGSVADLLGDDTDILDIIGRDPDDEDEDFAKHGERNQNSSSDEEDVDFGIPGPKYSNDMTNVAMFDPERIHDTPQPSSESGMRFDELYRLKGVLGTGAFSTVREGYHRSNSNISYAVKCINRKKLSEEDEAALLDEVGILKELRHDHIIRLYDFFVEPSTYYLVMERMRGGELFDRIVAKAYYNEKEARDTCKLLLQAVGHCHDNHIAHRDLKPENLLLLSENDDSAVKIADFGFAKKVYERNSLTTQCGTPGYVAPEILEGTPYDERADMWSVGVILYILLGGYPPFIESTQRDLFRKIRRGEYEFHEEYWGTVSSEAKELISQLLTVDVNARLTADEALENQWITGDDAKLMQRDLGANLEKMRNFNAKRKFRAVVSTIIAINKLNSLKEEFFSTMKDTAIQEVVLNESTHSRSTTSSGSKVLKHVHPFK